MIFSLGFSVYRFGVAVDLSTSESKVPVRILGRDVSILFTFEIFKTDFFSRFFCESIWSSGRSLDLGVIGPQFES